MNKSKQEKAVEAVIFIVIILVILILPFLLKNKQNIVTTDYDEDFNPVNSKNDNFKSETSQNKNPITNHAVSSASFAVDFKKSLSTNGNFISISECKRILNKNGLHYSDEETETVRNILYKLAGISYQQLKYKNSLNIS